MSKRSRKDRTIGKLMVRVRELRDRQKGMIGTLISQVERIYLSPPRMHSNGLFYGMPPRMTWLCRYYHTHYSSKGMARDPRYHSASTCSYGPIMTALLDIQKQV